MSIHEQEPQDGPDEVPTEETLDVEGPNESTEPSGAPGLDEGADDGESSADAEGNG
jgi:hypothetical protein